MSGKSGRSIWLGITVILAAIAAIYHPAVTFPFVWTDHAEIEEKTLVPESLAEMGRMLIQPKGTAKAPSREAHLRDKPASSYAYYRPTKALTYGLDDQIGGSAPWSYHLTNLILHAACCVLLLLVGREIFGARLPFLAESVALLHAVMPLHVEAACWISARSDVLWGLFTLLGILILQRARRSSPGWRRHLLLSATGLLVLLAAGSKESGLAMAGILAAYSAVFEDVQGESWLRRVSRECWAPLAGAALYLVLRLGVVADIDVGKLGAGVNLWTMLDLFGRNLLQSFVPVNLRLADTVEVVSGPTLSGLLGPLFMLAWLYAGWRLRKKSPVLLFSAAGWLMAIAPVSQVFVLLHPRGERYLYVPAFFAELTLGYVCWHLAGQLKKPALQWAAIASGAAVLAGLMLVSHVRASSWADERLLFARAVIDEPRCAECWNNLAYAEAVRGNYHEAELACRQALAIDRSHYRGARDGFSLRYILIRSLLLQGKGHQALPWIWQLIRKGGPGPANTGLLLEALVQAAVGGSLTPGLLFFGD
jgi:hypothetical protein